MSKIIFGLFFSVLVSSCGMKRHQNSGYAGSEMLRIPASAGQGQSANNMFSNYGSSSSTKDSEQLVRMESQLNSDQEIKQYYHYKPLLKSDEQRINFLNQSSIEARNDYANSILFPVQKRDFSAKELEMISKRDIALGMSRKAVEESWGNPFERMPAGNSRRGNEMWVFKKLVPTSNGYKTEYRHVYFEAGHVAGWETKQ